MTEYKNIPIDKLHIDPTNVRPEPDIDPEFIDSVRDGVIQNLVVRPHGDGYGVVVGSRRFTAAKSAGLEEVSCVVREDLEDDDERAMDLSFGENEQRRDLPRWRVREHVMRRYGGTDGRKSKGSRIKEVADRLNLSPRSVRRYVNISEKLDSTLISRLKGPSERFDTDKELLETVSSEKSGLSRNEAEGFDFEKEKAKGFPGFKEIPVEVGEELVKSDFFLELQEKDKEMAHKVATEAAKAGRKRAPKVIRKWKKEMTKSEKKERKKGGRPQVELTITVNAMTADALDRMVESERYSEINRESAAVTAIGVFLQDRGLFED